MFSFSRRWLTKQYGQLIRTVDERGFNTNLRGLAYVTHPSTQKRVREFVSANTNVLICGHHHTGKLTMLSALGEHFAKNSKKRVAYTSAHPFRATRLNAYNLATFLGLRTTNGELAGQEQLESLLINHVENAGESFEDALATLGNADVLILDALERVHPRVVLAMDTAARRVRNTPQEAFGGLRVFASADFWRLPVHPTSDTGGYVFQLDEWDALFPKQLVLEHTHGQDPLLNDYTIKALYGNLTMDDIAELERLSFAGKGKTHRGVSGGSSLSSAKPMLTATKEDNVEEEDEETAEGEYTPSNDSLGTWHALSQSITSNAGALMQKKALLAGSLCQREENPQWSVLTKESEAAQLLYSALDQAASATAMGVPATMNLEVGHKVHLLFDSTEAGHRVPAGAVGEVTRVTEYHLEVLFPAQKRTLRLRHLRITMHHPDWPLLHLTTRQYPLYPRAKLCPKDLLNFPHCYQVNINCRRLADTNDLGNILARMRSFEDFTLRNTADFVRLDGMIHEPTRIYYSELLKRPMTAGKEQWCRNCKSFVPTPSFFSHWRACVKSVRWCDACSKTVPLDLLEPHREKHQLVLCMDCGQAVEWRHWEAHRLSCGAMMREVSPDNAFLPLRTRQLSLELGLDKRDLHTMKTFSRSMLPKSKL